MFHLFPKQRLFRDLNVFLCKMAILYNFDNDSAFHWKGIHLQVINVFYVYWRSWSKTFFLNEWTHSLIIIGWSSCKWLMSLYERYDLRKRYNGPFNHFYNLFFFPHLKGFWTHTFSFLDGESFKIFTSGYSDHLLSYTVDRETKEVVFDKPIDVELNFSFGHVSNTYNSIYFVHEVNDYDGNSNTGAVSRWTMGETLTKQEVNK